MTDFFLVAERGSCDFFLTCEIGHIHSSSEHHSRLQGTTPTKRAHSSFEALRKKVPVPKLPGASDIHKMPISQSKKTASLGHRATGETRLQPQAQDKVPTSSTNLDRSYKGLLSHDDDHPLASIAKHDSFSPSARSCENNFPDLANIVAPTQIDIDLTSDISRILCNALNVTCSRRLVVGLQ